MLKALFYLAQFLLSIYLLDSKLTDLCSVNHRFFPQADTPNLQDCSDISHLN